MKHFTIRISALVAYGLINALFVYKYSARVTEHFTAAALGYLLVVWVVIWLLYRKKDAFKKIPDWLYFLIAAALTIALAAAMFQFHPATIRVGRHPALHDWIARLLEGQYPYASQTHPSGFPFLFFLAMPFYFLGDLGLFQIFSFAAFAWLIHVRFGSGSGERLCILGLLTAAPIFLYEVVTRSDLFSNIVVALIYLEALDRCIRRAKGWGAFLLGLIGGLMLATRGIVLLIYLVAFCFLYRQRLLRQAAFFLGLAIGFAAILTPFAIWDWNSFSASGPFSIQTSYLPGWLLTLALSASFVAGWRAKSSVTAIRGQTWILFGIVATAFTLAAVGEGWNHVIFEDGFDIAYFGFCLPFLVLGLPSEK